MHRRNKTLPLVLVGALVVGAMIWCADLAWGQSARTSANSMGKTTATTPPTNRMPAAPLAAPVPAAAPVEVAPMPEPQTVLAAASSEEAGGVPVTPQIDAQSGIITHLPLQDAPIREVLRQLSNVSQKNIVPGRNVTGKVTADLFNVTWREALDAILRVSELGAVEEGNFIYVYPLKEMSSMEQARKHLVTKVFTLYYAKPEDVEKLLAPCMSKDGMVKVTPNTEAGVAPDETKSGGMNYALNDVLVVSDYEDNIKRVQEVIASVDQRPQQVLIEATILLVTLDDKTDLGVDFSKVPGVDFCKIGAFNNFGPASGTGTLMEGTKTPLGPLSPGIKDPVAIAQNGSAPLAKGFNGAVEFSSDTSVFIHALEGVADTSIVANPKLLVINKQLGQVHIGQRLGYQDTSTTTQTGGTTASISFLDVGTTLNVRPFVGHDDYIRMEVFPKDSSGSVTTQSGITIPNENTTQCTTNVMVKDGHTIVISGMFRDETDVSRSQVPVLGNLPLVGWLFRQKSDELKRQEVIILLTPRIIKLPADSVLSEQLKDDVQRFELGMRKEMSWYARDRLAACHLGWAKEHIAHGNHCWALWDLNMAASMSPAMHEAITLRESLTGEAIWAHEPRYSSSEYIIQKMWMNELGLDVNIVLPPDKPLDPTVLPESVRDALGMGAVPGLTPAATAKVSEDNLKTVAPVADVTTGPAASQTVAVAVAAKVGPFVPTAAIAASQPAASAPTTDAQNSATPSNDGVSGSVSAHEDSLAE